MTESITSIERTLRDVLNRLEALETAMAEQRKLWEHARNTYAEMHPEPAHTLTERIKRLFGDN